MSLSSELSPADIAACTCGNNNDGFGGGNGGWWLIVLFLFALMGGWNNGGYGNGGGTGVYENYTLVSDMGQLERKIDTVNNGLCDGFYSTAQLINGVNMQAATNTAAIQNTLTQGFAGLNTGMVQQGYEGRIATHAVSDAVKDCCCTTQQNIKDTQYAIATTGAGIQNQLQTCCCDVQRQIERGFADTNYNLAINTNSIVQNAHSDADRIIARLDAMENSRKDEKIAEQACIINNQYLLSQINRTPVPAYQVPNPYCNCNCNNTCCG